MIKKLFLNDKFILWLILLNSAILFADGFLASTSVSLNLSLVDNFITTLFLLEILIKFKELGIKSYFKSGWNRLDFILVLISIPTLVAFTFQLDITDLSFLLVFRIMRVFKAFRFFKFIPDAGKLVEGLQRALKASIFVFIGFTIYIFIVGMLSYYLFSGSGSEYFKDPLISLYSTFKIFTVEGWFEIPEDIVVNYSNICSFATYLYFIFIVTTGGIFGLSIVNSIFVDTMVSDNNDELEDKVDVLDTKLTEILTKLNTYEARKDT